MQTQAWNERVWDWCEKRTCTSTNKIKISDIEWDNIFNWAKLAPMVAGECLHAVIRRTHFGHRRWKKKSTRYILLYKGFSRVAEMVADFQEWSPLLVYFCFLQPWPQTFVSTKKFDLVLPGGWSPSHRSVSNRYIPNKISSNPAMFRQVCGCEMLVATAAATHTHAIYDHGFTPAACAKARTRAFQRWKISSHPRDQWRSDGGVTIDRQRFRKRTSSAPSCFLYRVRPPPKQSTADTQALKYISLAHIEIVFCVAISDDLRAYV